jgi:hypothetical protein
MNKENFKISDVLFKIIISSSLPLSWDTFTEPYVGGRKGVIETDPNKVDDFHMRPTSRDWM